jgi:hypothetical protein
VSIGVAPSSHERGLAVCSDTEKGVLVARRDHCVRGSVDCSVGAIFETDRHRQAACELAMGLALARARADPAPAEKVCDELRCEGIEDLASARDSEFVDLQQQPAGDFETGRNVAGAVEPGIVDEPLPPNGGSRLFEIRAHDQDDRVRGVFCNAAQVLRVFEGRFWIVYRAGTDDDDQSIRVSSVDHVPDGLPRLDHRIRRG